MHAWMEKGRSDWSHNACSARTGSCCQQITLLFLLQQGAPPRLQMFFRRWQGQTKSLTPTHSLQQSSASLHFIGQTPSSSSSSELILSLCGLFHCVRHNHKPQGDSKAKMVALSNANPKRYDSVPHAQRPRPLG